MKTKTLEEKRIILKKIQENKGKLPNLMTIVNLIKNGMSQNEIALKYGVSRQGVNNVLRRYEIKNIYYKKSS